MTPAFYYNCYLGSFWQWEEEGEVLALPAGDTIAYRKQVADILEMFVPQGLPSFGSLLLAIIATNKGADMNLDFIYKLMRSYDTDNILQSALSFLELLSRVPNEYKQGMKRTMLLMSIFENCHNILSKQRSVLLQPFVASGSGTMMLYISKDKYPDALFKKDFRTIALLGNKYKTVDDILRKIASLPELPEPVVLPEEENETTAPEPDFLGELLNNNKTFHVAALVKRIWSGLNVPFHTALPSMQPLGGVSDITNKGDFDKLLVSEFANEDIVLLSRLANNEALYLHRETPPEHDTMRRTILIDVSLKNWGIPKTIAFATAIALAKHPKNKMRCDIYAVGKQTVPLSLDSINDIINGVQVLDGSLHAAQGLELFFKDHPADSNNEIFFITEATTHKQSELLKVLHDHNRVNYWVLTDNKGNLDIYKKQHRSKKHIQHMELPLQELWEKQQSTQKGNRQVSLHFPVLFKAPEKYKKACAIDNDLFILSERMLFKMYRKSDNLQMNGWEIILPQVAHGHLYEIGKNENGEYILLTYNHEQKHITLLNIATGHSVMSYFDYGSYITRSVFIYYEHKFYYTNNGGSVTRIDMDGRSQLTTDVNFEFVQSHKKSQDAILSQVKTAKQAPFRNISDIYISNHDKLVFNTHELDARKNGHLMLNTLKPLQSYSPAYTKDIIAERDNNIFTFPDGSTIEIFRIGILKFTSSSKAIPVVYVTSMINASLAAATDSYFAGNDFYNKSLPVIPVWKFYTNYIHRFISHIKNPASSG